VNERAQRRFALAVVDNLEDAMTITHHLIRSDLEPKTISIIGQEASFAGERQTAVELSRIIGRRTQVPNLMVDSNRIVSLGHDTDTLPKVIAEGSEVFGRILLQWLSPEHAERLTKAVFRGEFLLLIELHSMVEERIAMRALLRNCRGSVEVHDFDASKEELRL
jgi:hypothetical protein